MTNSTLLKSVTALIFATSALVPVGSSSAFANTRVECSQTDCRHDEANAANPGDDLGFSISVDGEVVDGSNTLAAEQRDTDVDLNKVDIQVKFDGLEVKPMLNVSTDDIGIGYQTGELIGFTATSNYPAWIASSEIRIFKAGSEATHKPIAIVPVNRRGGAAWEMPDDENGEFSYVLRVYDEQGRFDETQKLTIRRINSDLEKRQHEHEVISAGNGEDRTAIRNIPVYGGAVTIFGDNVPDGYTVKAIGEELPIDGQDKFVVQRILPPGDHHIDVSLDDENGEGIAFDRAIHIPQNDWFYVALADLTIGHRFGDRDLVSTNGEYDKIYKKGRLAFYLKGKIKGKYLLTAAADTKEGDLDSIFSNLNDKDPRQLLRRIDPDDYYAVYGDDSTSVEDAPTKGRFYVRLERGQSHVMWGSYKTTIKGSKFIRNERGLYGAHGVYKSESVTKHGDSRVEVEAYASQPDTLPQRDVMRGTAAPLISLHDRILPAVRNELASKHAML